MAASWYEAFLVKYPIKQFLYISEVPKQLPGDQQALKDNKDITNI
jgi:hypothetical protein